MNNPMNLIISNIPENWNPNDLDSFNRWSDKVFESVLDSKGLKVH